ncbi:transposase [Streptomyces canus]|uniref:transposase n=1 Tax=Streptomyces canus TaxID=58343 RepID=UPI0033ACD5D9
MNGMVYKIRTGMSWCDLPERYGPWQAVCTRFRRYALEGVFTRASADPSPCGCDRRHRLARPDRLHHRPCPPARRHRQKRAWSHTGPAGVRERPSPASGARPERS